MQKTIFFPILVAVAMLFTHCTDQPSTLATRANPDAEVPATEDLAKRGEYLVTIMGCHDCHSPKRMGPQGPEIIPERLLSGYPGDQPLPEVSTAGLPAGWAMLTPDLTAAVGPWGVSFAANITADATGIGNWTEEQFRKALTQGKSKGIDGARPLLPPMPWFNYANIEDEDLQAIFAYLKSTHPVHNIVPPPIPPDQLQ